MKAKLLILGLFCWFGSVAQSVPNTNTFRFTQVVFAVYGDSTAGRNLSDTFTASDAAYFDATYGSKTMSPQTINGFRNYRPTFLSAAIYDYYTRDDCSSGYHGTEVLVDFSAGAYISYTSQIDADDQASEGAQYYTNANGNCIADACTRPNPIYSYDFYTVVNGVTVTGANYNSLASVPCGSCTFITAQAISVSLWYLGTGTDCTLIPDGYYAIWNINAWEGYHFIGGVLQ